QTELKETLEQQTKSIENIIDLENSSSFSERIQKFRSYLTELKKILHEEETKVDQISALQQEVKQLTTNKQNIKDKMNTLIETAGVKDEATFFDLYKQKEVLDAKKSRLSFLKENTPSFNEEKELP